MRAEKAEIRQALHPAIGRGATPELGVVVVAWGVAVVKVNIPVGPRNATSLLPPPGMFTFTTGLPRDPPHAIKNTPSSRSAPLPMVASRVCPG